MGRGVPTGKSGVALQLKGLGGGCAGTRTGGDSGAVPESRGVVRDAGAACCLFSLHDAGGILNCGLGLVFVMIYVRRTSVIN